MQINCNELHFEWPLIAISGNETTTLPLRAGYNSKGPCRTPLFLSAGLAPRNRNDTTSPTNPMRPDP